MLFGYLTLFTALIISLSAAVYSILGLTAIFAAAFWPIVVLGGSLEFGKIITTLWLHKYWERAEIQYKVYLCSAVAILTLLTSMGVFGFLSKAHSDQSLVSGDVGAKIAIYDEKIKISRENIDANRRALKQMDEAVDQVMGRSSDEKGADKAVAIRRSQNTERTRLLKEIDAEQKKITNLNEEAAPIRAENRKVEAEVGPIKYIAALIYGDNPDANVLEHAVRWVIILIVVVFDPLALTLLLAATKTLEWERGTNIFATKKRDEELFVTDKHPMDCSDIYEEDPPVFEREEIPLEEEPIKKKSRWAGFGFPLSSVFDKPTKSTVEEPVEEIVIDEPLPADEQISAEEKEARRRWKEENPGDTIKHQKRLFETGAIKKLPWNSKKYWPGLGLEADNSPDSPIGEVRGFGTSFPENVNKGDMFLRVDQLPSRLYKFNGTNWIEIDKELSDQHAYDDAYIDHLIQKISTGEYDPELLSNAERDSIEQRLNNNPRQV